MGFYQHLEELPPDPILGLTHAFQKDPRPDKVNLGVGIYYGADLKPLLPTAVREAEVRLLEERLPKTYLPIDGDQEFVELTAELVFGKKQRLYGAQTVGGTSALRLAGDLLAGPLGIERIFLSDPTWANHRGVFTNAGLTVESYSYLKGHGIDLDRLSAAISSMPPKSAILFHASCHNPTGFDPSREEWEQIADLVAQRGLLPLFDCAYQGLGDGLEEDVWAPRLFTEKGMELLLAYSYSKNMGLYGERVGACFAVMEDSQAMNALRSQACHLIRRTYSNPPAHGARVSKIVLQDRALRKSWEEGVTQMRGRIHEMRRALATGIASMVPTSDFSFIERQRGLFSLTGLQDAQVERLKREKGIYMAPGGRINITGLNRDNIQSVIEAIATVL